MRKEIVHMFEVNDLFVEAVIQERERWVARLAREALMLRGAQPARPHTLRQRVGLGLIQAGRAVLRHEPAYAAERRRLA